MIAKERLYLTKDKTEVVKEGDPKAAFLLCCKGNEIPAEFIRLVTESKKEIKETEDKEIKETENKSKKTIKFGGKK